MHELWSEPFDDTPATGEAFGEGVAVGDSDLFMNTGVSESNFTQFKIDVYVVPSDTPPRRRAVRP
jgi:hypothetical protein